MRGRWVRALGWVIVLVIVIGAALPFISADRLREPLRAALENALGRKVTLGEMHWNLFTGPGLRADNVTIGEDPALGNEPIAYAGSLVAMPSISSLWHRRLECSSLRLEDTHVNVARSGEGAAAVWNFTMLARPRLLAAFPAIRLRGARVNFRMNQVKSVFYLLDTDLDIEPVASDGSDWRVRIQGQPARTDRAARGFGSFEANGRWRVQPGRTGKLDLQAKLENSEISDILQLLRGDDFGLQGHVAGQLTLSGEPSLLTIDGAMRMDQLHGWEQVPPSGDAWRFQLRGSLNSIAQELDIHARVPGNQPVLQAHLRMSHYLSEAAWGIQTTLQKMPLDPLMDVARHLGASMPPGTRLSGTADGVIGYAPTEGFAGSVAISNARFALPKSAPFEMAAAQIRASREKIELAPADVTLDNEHAALSASYLPAQDQLRVSLSSAAIALEALQKQAEALGIPLVPRLENAQYSGELNYLHQPGSAGWGGTIHLSGARVAIDGMTQPVMLSAGDMELQAGNITAHNLRGKVAGIAFDGDYSYVANGQRPHQFHLNFGSVEALAVEKLWLPLLKRQNLLDRALGRTATPAWLTNWHADGSIQFNVLSVAGLEMRRVKTHVRWDEGAVVFEDVKAKVANGDLSGLAGVDVSGGLPSYTANLKLVNADWKNTRANVTSTLMASGLNTDMGKSLNASGTFEQHDLRLPQLPGYNQLSGQYQIAGGTLRLTGVKLAGNGTDYTGTGQREPDGRVRLDLSNETDHIQCTISATGGVEIAPAANR